MTNPDHPGSAWQAARLSWSLLQRPEKRRFAAISVGHAAASLIDTISLVGVMPLVTVIIEPGSIETNPVLRWLHESLGKPEFATFIAMLAALAIFLLVAGIGSTLAIKIATKRFGVSCQNRLAKELMGRCLAAPYSWLVNQNTTSLARLVYSDVLMWSNDGVQRMIATIGHLTLLAFSVVVVFVAAQLAGLAGLAVIGLLATAAVLPLRARIRELSQARRSADAGAMARANEILGGAKDVKMSGRESTFVGMFTTAFSTYGDTMATLKLLQSIPPVALLLLGQTGLIVIAVTLWWVGNSSGEIAAQMALVLLVTSRVIPATIRLASEVGTMWNVIPHVDGIQSLLSETAADPAAAAATQQVPADWRTIEIIDLAYTHRGSETASVGGITTTIRRGASYGIVGPSGAGKTTLVDLLLGLLTPSAGHILLDGNSLHGYDPVSWRNRVGYVSQSPVITDDTLRANVAFGTPKQEIDNDHVIKCLKLANLGDLLSTIGLTGMVGERGGRLSGGERQRVAIARALYDKPDLLVFDEATSALDNVNERGVLDAIANLSGVITTVTIAHRLTTIEHCDQVLLLDQGRLVASGTYDNLSRDNAAFRTLVDPAAGDKPSAVSMAAL